MKSLPQHAVIITGLPLSGKTTASNFLKSLSFFVVSAGEIIREMCIAKGIPTTRKSLQFFGQSLLNQKGFEYFANMLLEESRGAEKVVFDGIRFVQVIKIIKTKIKKVLVIYVEADENNRKKRFNLSKGVDEMQYLEILEAPLELEVLKSKRIADVVIDNNSDKEKFLNSIYKAVVCQL